MTSAKPAKGPHRSHSGSISMQLMRGGERMGRDSRTMATSLQLWWFSFTEFLTLIGWVAATLLSMLGLSRLDPAFNRMRRNTEQQREWASEVLGQRLTARYAPSQPATDDRGLARLGQQLQDQSRAKDLDWHLVNPIVGAIGSVVPFIIGLSGLTSILFGQPLMVVGSIIDAFRTLLGASWYSYYWGYYGFLHPVPTVIGVLLLILAPVSARLLQRLHARWVKFMLVTDVSETLAERVASLTETRKTALELQEAEIRRIERDLHDGAQARLVTMGMTLTQASRLMEHDPDGARAMLDAAKGDSAEALRELRTLVRGIRPPILADRGLVEAVRSLAKASPVETRVVSSLNGRLVPTLETALYFAVAELLTNAAKHSCATEIVVELTSGEDVVTVVVTDNGIGGAELAEGGGLAGLAQRLAPFDARFEFVSPVGGPTVATVRAPLPA